MLPKINRIKKKNDFAAIFTQTKGFKNNLFILKIKRNSFGFNRFGFVISQKVSKKATLRNKIRRRLVAVVKNSIKSDGEGMDLVFVALPESSKKDFREIKSAAENLLVKSGLIKNV